MREPRYFHQLAKAKWDTMQQQGGMTWGELSEKYKQPLWCSYPGALHGGAGCWSLVGRRIDRESKCRGCECHVGKRRRAA